MTEIWLKNFFKSKIFEHFLWRVFELKKKITRPWTHDKYEES